MELFVTSEIMINVHIEGKLPPVKDEIMAFA